MVTITGKLIREVAIPVKYPKAVVASSLPYPDSISCCGTNHKSIAPMRGIIIFANATGTANTINSFIIDFGDSNG